MHYFVYDRPAGTICTENPARFTWMPASADEAPYRIEVRRNGEMAYCFEPIDRNFYTPDCLMEPGEYTYRVYARSGLLVPEKPFSIAEDAVHTPLIRREERYTAIGSHPRIWLGKEDLPRAQKAIQSELKQEWASFLASGVDNWLAAPLIREPERYPNDIRVIPLWRQMYTDCQEALYTVKHLAVAYRLTGDEQYLQKAKAQLLSLSEWDLSGPTARSYNDESAFRVATALAWGYDWLYEALSAQERAQIRRALLERGRELYHYVHDKISIHTKLLDSHGVRSLSMTLVPAALVLYGEEPEAEEWLNYTVEYFFTLFTPWGGDDGGWAEGPTYWQSGVSFFTEAISLLWKATGLNVFERPFFRNTGDFILNTYCQDTRFMAFGDMSDLGDYPGMKAGFTMRILSAATSNPNAPVYAWYCDQAKERGKGTEGMFYNYGWWNFDFDELFFRLLYPQAPAPKAPDNALTVRQFPHIGWATIHKHMAEEERHLAFYFKASPYGAVSHSHGDQNAFVLHAFGEPLAIQSGYYIGYWSSMHINWRRQTKSKNAITVGGVGQFAELRKATKDEAMNGSARSMYERLIASRGRIEACEQKDGLVYLRGDAAEAFAQSLPNVKSNKRHVLFVDESYFVMVDEIELAEAETIEYRLHALQPFAIGRNEASMQGAKAGMRVLFDQDMAISQSDVFDGADMAEVEGLPVQYHLCAATCQKRCSHRLVSVLYPYAAGEEKQIALQGDTITFDGVSRKLVRNGQEYTIL